MSCCVQDTYALVLSFLSFARAAAVLYRLMTSALLLCRTLNCRAQVHNGLFVCELQGSACAGCIAAELAAQILLIALTYLLLSPEILFAGNLPS